MGFLSGVLGAVKNENEVETYDKHFNKRLNEVLEEVNKNIGSGREGLAESVGAVKKWLEGYEKKLNEKINELKNPLEQLRKDIESDKTSIENEKHNELSKQIADWTTRADWYHGKVTDAKIALNNVDPTLSGKLKCNISLLVQATETFKVAARNTDLDAMFKLAAKKWAEITAFLEKTFLRYSHMLQAYLKHEVGALHEQIISLQGTQFNDLFTALNTNLTEAFKTVNYGIHKVESSYDTKVVSGLTPIVESAITLKKEVQSEKAEIKKQVVALVNQIELIGIADQGVKARVTNDAALVQDRLMLSEVVEDVKSKIRRNVEGYVEKILPDQIYNAIQKETDTICNNDGINGYLNESAHLVAQWARTFSGKDQFGKKVGDWVEDILKQDVVSGWLTRWITWNKHSEKLRQTTLQRMKDGNNDTLRGVIIEAIKEEFINEITKAGNAVNIKSAYNIEENVEAVIVGIGIFMEKLGEGFGGRGDKILEKIENNEKLWKQQQSTSVLPSNLPPLPSHISPPTYDNQHLKLALQATLVALQSKARQVWNELNSFALKSCKIGNVEKAITDVKRLAGTLKRKLIPNPSTVIGSAPTDLGNTIRGFISATAVDVEDELAKLLKSTADNAIDELQKKIKLKVNTQILPIQQALTALQSQNGPHVTTGVPQGKSALESLAHELHEKINDLLENNVGTSATKKGSVYADLNELMMNIETLGGEVGSVRSKVEAVAVELTSCIRRATNLLKDTPREIEKCFNKLRIAVTVKIDSAFTEMEQQTRDLYTARKTQEVTALHKIVKEQFQKIEGTIKTDKETHLKGILSKLKKQFIQCFEDHATKLSATLRNTDQPKLSEQEQTVKYFAQMLRDLYNRWMIEVYGQEDFKKLKRRWEPSRAAFHFLLSELMGSQHFNHEVHIKLDALNALLTSLHPSSFADSPSPLLAPLKAGLSKFAEQLGRAYVNRYSGKRFNGALLKEVEDSDSKKAVPALKQKSEKKYDLTPEGRNCAKVCLTIVEMVKGELDVLREKCKLDWHSKQIDRISVLGSFLSDCGYVVSNRDKQDGELRRSDQMMGSHIHAKIRQALTNVENIKTHLLKCKSNEDEKTGREKKSDKFHVLDVLACLHCHLETYYTLGHMASLTAKRNPCSVYEMLVWCAGLHYNSVYEIFVRDGFTGLMEKPKKKIIQASDDGLELDAEYDDLTAYYVDVFPSKIRYDHIHSAINHICATSHDVLTRIIGHGDEYTTYGVDFCNNSLKFRYPTSAEECLDMFLDILRRLFPPLKYLETQCSTAAREYGWAGCHYGKDVQTTNWPCNEHSSTKVTCQPNGQAKCEPNCQPKSPLMSYLYDCLPGHLPHVLTDIGCKAKCSTCPRSTPGMPCLTPLGFRGFSGTKRAGRDISDVLGKFFDNGKLNVLFSLQTKTPSTLPEHFGFTLSLVAGWVGSDNKKRKTGVEEPFEEAITNVSIELYEKPTKLTEALRNAYGDPRPVNLTQVRMPPHAALSSLSITGYNDPALKAYCTPYMLSLSEDYYSCLPFKNSKTYLSWAVYLPWDFWKYLKSLYDEFCNILCADWGCRTCLRADKCRRGQHGLSDDKTKTPYCQCASIVQCRGVSPILYRYGFCFGEASTLNAKSTRKTCSQFCKQLYDVLHSQYFRDLFDKCDDFLLCIRWPFMLTVLTLWLLSFLYLIHIMVIRLDLLHIKSHLHSPSSHRIAAQSLLAAARVNKLNRVFYLQP
ncbi:hypothetical protein, conserved [Babesia bigemina]|uniref:C3H1-type domain-containing protein n=1 Tax=Babesia bigemina TaxID=5866 RepID=A0A061BJ09_BABBI|nr:hypothetical protein, conserved [Babesia bigemina]CDR71465.1 hypothetical protein, conserved [Babesia bigemina]|eukprot:XP_012770412.1 hypothetical protein, conserved [Babesia bigemina]